MHRENQRPASRIRMESPLAIEHIQEASLLIRGKRVILDADLAQLYGVSTKRLNEHVKRNRGRFPKDFMFQSSSVEVNNSRSQSATSKAGGDRTGPY